MQEKKCDSDIENRIKHIRAKLGLTQAQFAELLGCDQAAISRLEKGKKQPDIEIMSALHAKCEVDINWFLTGKGSETYQQTNNERQPIGAKVIDLRANIFASEGLRKANEWLKSEIEIDPRVKDWFDYELCEKFPKLKSWINKKEDSLSNNKPSQKQKIA